jgi:transcriptional regulator with XRE-family HTH domain
MTKEHDLGGKVLMTKEHDGEIMPLDIQSPITRIRMLKGLTRVEIAVVLGTTVTTISNMEEGTVEINERLQEEITNLGFDGAEEAELQKGFIKKKSEWLSQHMLHLLGES